MHKNVDTHVALVPSRPLWGKKVGRKGETPERQHARQLCEMNAKGRKKEPKTWATQRRENRRGGHSS